MRYKQAPLLLLAAALLLLGAFLPRLTGGIQDTAAIGKTDYAQLNQIQLETDGPSPSEAPDNRLSTAAKLSILKGFAGSLELPDSMAAMTHKELLAIAKSWATRYYDAGLLPGSPVFDSTDMQAQAYLVYRDNERAFSNIFWRLELVCCGGSLEFIIDDETGTVCTILFSDQAAEPDAEGYLYDMDASMGALCQLYLEGLGEEFSKYNPGTIAKNSQRVMSYEGDTDYSGLTTELSWGDIRFGQTAIYFSVSPHGFYTVIL